jgi:hypothetical protein
MDARKAIYDRLSAVLTDYENDNADSDDLYQMLVDIQNAWEFTITAELGITTTTMDASGFAQWIFAEYAIGDSYMARELVTNILDFAHGIDSAEQYGYLRRMLPQVPDSVLRNVRL